MLKFENRDYMLEEAISIFENEFSMSGWRASPNYRHKSVYFKTNTGYLYLNLSKGRYGINKVIIRVCNIKGEAPFYKFKSEAMLEYEDFLHLKSFCQFIRDALNCQSLEDLQSLRINKDPDQ